MTELNPIQQLINFTSNVLNECSDANSFYALQKNIQDWKNDNDITVYDNEMIELLGKLEDNIEKMHSNALIISANELNARFLSDIRLVTMIKDHESAAILTKEICERYKDERKLWGEEFGQENFNIHSFVHVSGILTQLGFKLND